MSEKRRTHYSISRAAEELGVSPSWLRFAKRFGERLGALPRARHLPNGWRYHTSEDPNHLRKLGVGERTQRLASTMDRIRVAYRPTRTPRSSRRVTRVPAHGRTVVHL